MSDDGARDYSFAVIHEPNRQFAGKGRVVVRDDATGGRLVTLSGRTTRPFSRAERSASFAVGSIRNVQRHGAGVRFTADAMAKSGLQPQVFAFQCEHEADAATLVALLPTTIDETFVAEQEFADRLSRLPSARHAWTSITGLIVLTNLAVFLMMVLVFDAGWFEARLEPYMRFGANNGAVTTDGEWWRLVTSMFLHFGLLHVALNMWALFDAGRLLERLAGRALFTLLYFGSGIAGSLASLLWHGDRLWSAGASGAVFGVYGALLGYALREKGSLPATVFKPFLRSSLWFIGYNLLYGFAMPGIDNAAHVGGLLSGLGLGWLTALPLDRARREPLRPRRFVAGCVALALLVSAGVAAAPRFDYRLRDEIALETVLKEIGPRERQLVRKHTGELARYSSTGDNTNAFATWLEGEYLPFYCDLASRLAGLDLAPDRSTARRRELLHRYAEARAEGARQLIAAVRTDAPGALEAYEAAEHAASAAVEALNSGK